ncbi:hypothetical protein Cgig2_018376 [Carnegiea gigantea]|uniref:Uncharacterized protein n=1 Tax=Carnegiea gigantea TaxID=171969 RepID=A0A9Q1JUN7_9CARY|nr:hypothetical protein Cgig2_018376 [Carnegiea gigantea]
MGGDVVESRDGKVTYEGGSRKCMVVREGLGAEELLKMVRKMTGSDMSEEKLWYSLKYDREILVAIEVDSDLEVIFKGNDEHGYIYIAGNAGLVRAAVCEARVRDTGEGKQIARSGRKCNDGEEVGEEHGNNETGVKRSLGVEGGEQPASRLRLGGDTIEMSNDDEISVASEDAGDEEVTEEDDAGDKGVAAEQCGDGNKRKGCADGNDVNDNNGVGERIEQKLADTYKKMGCIAAVECYSLMLGECNVELTNSCRLVVKLGQWQMRGLPCCHALAIIAKANIWVYSYVHPIYKTVTQKVIYNQLVHPIETHDMAVVDGKTGLVVGGMNWMRTTTDAYYPPTMADTRAGHRRSEESCKPRTRKCSGAQNAVKLAIQGARAIILELISMQVTKVHVCADGHGGDAWHASVYIYLAKVQTCVRDCIMPTMGSAAGVGDVVRCPLPSFCAGILRRSAAVFCVSGTAAVFPPTPVRHTQCYNNEYHSRHPVKHG